MKRTRTLGLALALCAVSGIAGVEFSLDNARCIYPCYRTWEFAVEEPGLYAFDIAVPEGAKAHPSVRLWLDGTQIAFSRGGADWDAKEKNGRLRRCRWLDPGTHSLDLYLHLGPWEFEDEMEKAMGEKQVRARVERLSANENSRNGPQIANANEAAGFWMEGKDPDSMARVAGEPLVVAGCLAGREPREFTMEVSDGWSQTLAVGTTPVRFSYPCPEEGTFQYLVRDAATGEVVEGPWDFVVTDLRHATGDARQVAVLVDRVDCSESAGGPHLFRENGTSDIVETPNGTYRQTGPGGCHDTFYDKSDPGGNWRRIPENAKGAASRRDFDWFGYTLRVAHPGKTHILVCKIPNDVRRLTHVFAYDRRTGRNNGWGLDTGDAPAAGAWSELRIPVWPNTNALDVMVVNTDGVRNSHFPHPNRRGAVAELSLVEYPNGLPPLPAPPGGWSATREFGWDGEQIDLGPNERTMPQLSDEAVSALWSKEATVKGHYRHGPAHSWADMASTWERTFELEAWRGGTTLTFPVYSYGMVSLQGPAQKILPPANDRYAVNRVGATCADPFDRDTFALMLQRAEKHGIKLVADFMVQRTYGHVAEAWARMCGDGVSTNGFYLSAAADGSPYRPVICICAGMPNPAHPAARKAQIEFCREMGRRYGRYASFAGIQHRFLKGWPGSFEPWFHSAETGFDDFTVGEFSKATGIALPSVGTDEAAFDARKKRIRAEHPREWDAWRAKVCRSLNEEMLAALREGAPQARFYVLRHGDDGTFAPGSGLDPDELDGRCDLGFDDAQVLVDGPGVEINDLDPATFGHFYPHLDQRDLPLGLRVVPSSICCNRSYRCAPYHLEPAALALAENRLDHLWMGGQWCLPPADETLRDFIRAYRAIPDRDDWRRCGAANAPVAVWWAKDGDDVLFWSVNRTDARRRVVLHFDRRPPSLEITLAPFMPGVFRAKGAGALLGFEVPVEPEEAAKIEKDFRFLATFGVIASKDAVERSSGTGAAYFPNAGALGRLDERWTWRDLFAPMEAARDAGDLLGLRILLADFRARHRWWFEAFGWPEDLCVTRQVARKPLAGFLDAQRTTRPEEVSFRDAEGIETATMPQSKHPFVVAARDEPLDIKLHGVPGGMRQIEINALFGGGYGDIRVEDWDGKLLGTISSHSHSPRLETRILAIPVPCLSRDVFLRIVGTGEKGLAIQGVGASRLPPRPVREWDVIGPFDAGRCDRAHDGRAVVTNAFPPEVAFEPDAAFVGIRGAPLRWRKAMLGEGERVFDMKALTPCETSSEIGVSYLRATVRSPNHRRTILHYSSDWFGTIWLNGEPVVAEMAGPSREYAAVSVHLNPGDNVILVKTAAGSAGWHFGLALDDDGTLRY